MSARSLVFRSNDEVLYVGGLDRDDQQVNIEVLRYLEAVRRRRANRLEALLDSGWLVDLLAGNKAWTGSSLASAVLALTGPAGENPATGALADSTLRLIVQALTRQSQSQAAQINALWRVLLATEQPGLLDTNGT